MGTFKKTLLEYLSVVYGGTWTVVEPSVGPAMMQMLSTGEDQNLHIYVESDDGRAAIISTIITDKTDATND